MPKSKNLANYPSVYLELVDYIKEHPEKGFTLAYDSRQEAQSAMLDWYAFRRAYLAAERHLDPHGFRDIGSILTRVKQRQNSWIVEFEHVDHTARAKAIAAGLEAARLNELAMQQMVDASEKAGLYVEFKQDERVPASDTGESRQSNSGKDSQNQSNHL